MHQISVETNIVNSTKIHLLHYECVAACEKHHKHDKSYNRIIIELDGVQHYQHVAYFNRPVEETQRVDFFKMQCAFNAGYIVIRILQEDVCRDRHNWRRSLVKVLHAIKNGRSSSQNIFIDNRGEHDNHRKFAANMAIKTRKVQTITTRKSGKCSTEPVRATKRAGTS